jgi:hypothetical protein
LSTAEYGLEYQGIGANNAIPQLKLLLEGNRDIKELNLSG